jgi:hypothetical protein
MELEMPADTICPLCRQERVELRENKSGNPYFQCEPFNTVVNMRPEKDEAITMLNELQEADLERVSGELAEPEGESDDSDTDEPETRTLGDLLNEEQDDD